jgi:hypothetical protein
MADIDPTSPWPGPHLAGLLRPCTWPVPLLGAGISAGAGLPLGSQLAAWIEAHELAAGVEFSSLQPAERSSPLRVSQLLIDERPRVVDPLRQAVRDLFVERCGAAQLTPELLHLARTPGRLIVTLNYDDLIERAASEQGIEVCSLSRDEIHGLIGGLLPRPTDALRVVHVHGSVRSSEPFVLDMDGYSQAMAHGDIPVLFGAIISQRSFCLLGTSFEEPYLRDLFRRYRDHPPRHVIVCEEPSTGLAAPAALGSLEGIVACSYPVGRHAVVVDFCAALVECDDEVTAAGTIVAPAQLPRDPLYVQRRLLPLEGDEDPRVALLLGRVQLLHETGLIAQTRAVVIGAPGSGKTELLRRLAVESPAGERVALVRLRDVRELTGTPEMLLGDWLGLADPVFGTIEANQAAQGAIRVHLLLDALDEQAPGIRQAAAAAIARVGERFPAIRMTLTSRPSAALDLLPPDWQRYELVCDTQWADEFLQAAGDTRLDLEQRLGSARAAVAPLLTIPFYLRRLRDFTDEELSAATSQDALALILALLDRSIDEDPNLARVTATTRRWLSDVALRMQLTGRRSVPMTDLQPLTARLDLGDVALLTDQLAGRSLLEENAGEWSFGHRLFSDALVAHALRSEDPAAWLDVMAPIAFSRSALREDWRSPFELLASGSDRWRRAVAGRDPVAAARVTPPSAPRDERRRAIHTLWRLAHDLQIWILGGGPNEPDDAARIAAMLAPGDLNDELRHFEEALDSPSRYDRANALDVLLTTEPGRAESRIPEVLNNESDSTVRRNAATWARKLEITAAADAVLARALDPADEPEATDMASIALYLADPGEQASAARRILRAGNKAVLGYELSDEAPQLDRLLWLRDQFRADPDQPNSWLEQHVLDVLLEIADIDDASASAAGEVLALAHASLPQSLSWVAANPAAGRGIVLALSREQVHTYQIVDLLLALGSDQLGAAGANDDTVEWIRAVEQARDQRVDAADVAPARDDPAPTAPSLEDVLALSREHRFAALVRQAGRRARQARAAPEAIQGQVRAVINESWQGRNLRAAVEHTEGGATVEHWASLVLTYGPATSFSLNDARWVEVATCGWLFGDQITWLGEQVTQERLDVAADAAPLGARHLSDLLMIAQGRDISPSRVIARIDDLTAPIVGADRYRLLHGLAAAQLPAAVRHLCERHPEVADMASPLLAAAGDVQAQRVELAKLLNDFGAGRVVDRHDALWLDELADPSLLEPLVEVVTAGKQRESEPGAFDAVENALVAVERIGGRRALDALDLIVAEPPWPGAQWLYKMRENILQRELASAARAATAAVLASRGLGA